MTTLITKRCRAASARVDAVDLHHPRHRPESLDRHERAHAEARRAARSTRSADARTPCARPPTAPRDPARARASAMSGTRHADPSGDDERHDARAPTNIVRQCVTRSANSSGIGRRPARRAPPATIIQPANDACRSGGYHARCAFSGAIRHTRHAGADQRARDARARSSARRTRTASAPVAGDRQQHRLDAARTVAVEQHARRELHRGEREEIGAGQEPERRRVEAPRSRVSSGEMTALTVRKRYDSSSRPRRRSRSRANVHAASCPISRGR